MSSLKSRKTVKKRKLVAEEVEAPKKVKNKLVKKANKVSKSKPESRAKKVVKNTKRKLEVAATEFKAGKAVPVVGDNNCLSCMHWQKCPSKKKSRKHACTKLKLYPVKKESAAAKGPTIIIKGAVDKDAGLSKEERVISQLISRTLKSSGVVAADTRIDDRDISTAPNFYSWVTEREYMGTMQVPWAKQIEHPIKLLAEWCPNKRCTDIEWWNNVPVDATPGEFMEHVTFLEYGICPKCGTRKSEWVQKERLYPYNALVGLAGQRSSKTYSAMLIVTYNLHRLLKSQNPSAMYGTTASQVLTATFAALTFEQAKDNIWNTFYNMVSDAPWFMEYHEFLRQECYRLGLEDVFEIKQTYARYRHRNLFYHVSGPNKRTMRGKTRIEAMIDEIGWFIQQLKTKGKAGTADPERLDAKGTHDALDRSLLTVRTGAYDLLISSGNENAPMGYLYETSSPSAKTDMIMQRYAASIGSRTIYGYRMATWEANPKITRQHPDIVEAYREDPIAAERDYAANPPVSGSPFVKLPSLRILFSSKRENAGTLKTVAVTNSAGQGQTTGKLRIRKAHRGEPSILSIDAGSVNNSFAISVQYVSKQSGRVIVPFIGEVFPSHEAPIHFPDLVTNVITPLIEHYNVKVVLADRWQSIMLLQSLQDEHGVMVEQRSLKYPDFDNFRQIAIYDGGMQLPMLENKPKQAIKMAANPGYPGCFHLQPLSHLLFQLVAVQDIPNVTVNKPDGGTDDLFRSLVLGFTGLTDPQYAEFFVDEGRQPVGGIGVMLPGVTSSGTAGMSNQLGVSVGPRGSAGGASSGGMGVVSRRM